MRRRQKIAVALTVDILLCLISVWAAMFLRTETFQLTPWQLLAPAVASVVIFIPLMFAMGVYNEIARFAGSSTIYSIFKAFLVYLPIYAAILVFVKIESVPRSIGLLQPLILGALALNARLFIRGLASSTNVNRHKQSKNVLVFGADEGGRQIANALKQVPNVKLVGFLDDDHNLQNKGINGIQVFDPVNIEQTLKAYRIQEVLLTPGTLQLERKALLIKGAAANDVSVRVVPYISDLLFENITIDQLKRVEIEDLLGRDSVKPDPEFLKQNVTGKLVLVSGAGGSIGSELVTQLAQLEPKRLILLENSEFALYSIMSAIEKANDLAALDIQPVMGSVCDREKMFELVARFRPDTIFHAAAYKHVHIVERNPYAGLQTNYFGTKNLADAAAESNVGVFLLISSDKAVRPTNFMGATKRLSELYVQMLARQNKGPKFVAVRFGNVLGSSGSVVPAFRAQIETGGPITVTHPDMERYFMTISEAVELVIQATVIANNGAVLLLDMGEPVKIDILARQMVTLSGFSVRDLNNPGGQIEIVYSGLRPGEKLIEELFLDGQATKTTHPRIFKANESRKSLDKFQDLYQTLGSLDVNVKNNDIKSAVKKLVPEYLPHYESG